MKDRPSTSHDAGTRVIRCPGCGGDSVYAASNAYRPFCSARCRGADLGAWASEGYRVPSVPSNDDDPDDLSPPLNDM